MLLISHRSKDNQIVEHSYKETQLKETTLLANVTQIHGKSITLKGRRPEDRHTGAALGHRANSGLLTRPMLAPRVGVRHQLGSGSRELSGGNSVHLCSRVNSTLKL
jgi:hypothetical protein